MTPIVMRLALRVGLALSLSLPILGAKVAVALPLDQSERVCGDATRSVYFPRGDGFFFSGSFSVKCFRNDHAIYASFVVDQNVAGAKDVDFHRLFDGGYAGLNWVQWVTVNPYPAALNSALTAPYRDPPLLPEGASPEEQRGFAGRYPFYWPSDLKGITPSPFGNIPIRIDSLISGDTLISFEDAPRDPRLHGGQFKSFETSLVGVNWNALTRARQTPRCAGSMRRAKPTMNYSPSSGTPIGMEGRSVVSLGPLST